MSGRLWKSEDDGRIAARFVQQKNGDIGVEKSGIFEEERGKRLAQPYEKGVYLMFLCQDFS